MSDRTRKSSSKSPGLAYPEYVQVPSNGECFIIPFLLEQAHFRGNPVNNLTKVPAPLSCGDPVMLPSGLASEVTQAGAPLGVACPLLLSTLT